MEERASAQLCLGRDRRDESEPFSQGCCPPTPPLSLFYPPHEPEHPVNHPQHCSHLRGAHQAPREERISQAGMWESPGEGEAFCQHHGTSEMPSCRPSPAVSPAKAWKSCSAYQQSLKAAQNPPAGGGGLPGCRDHKYSRADSCQQRFLAIPFDSLPFPSRLLQEWLQTPAQSPTEIPEMPPGKAAAKGQDLHLANDTSRSQVQGHSPRVSKAM